MTKYAFTKEFSPENSSGVIAKAKHLLWAACLFLKNTIPSCAFNFGGGLGDHLLCTILFHELAKRGVENCWMLSHYPELFKNNPYNLKIVPDDWKTLKFLEKINRSSTLLHYGTWIGNTDRIIPPKHHMVVEILQKANIRGKVSIRPYWYQKTDHSMINLHDEYICVQSTNNYSSTEVKNKKWAETKMQAVVDKLSKRYCIVQIGMPEESKLENTIDKRASSISQSASLLANCNFFLGQEGFPMHLARAVETRSVIIYGGRLKAWQSGYPCNENIETNPDCSPCWQNNQCDYDRMCLKEITVEDVLEAIDRIEKRLPEKLETEVFTLN
ncbi:MAG: glycosyltransferase family 9 protein [Opitutales bacterium]|nr:glycosyltransferase family 9 protein [Opitutales bacterium]